MHARASRQLLAVAGAAMFLLASAPPGRAQTGGPYRLTWSTLDAGGLSFAAGGRYRVAGTAGQPDAGRHTGGPYSLRGGFWNPTGTPVLDAEPTPANLTAFALLPNRPNPFHDLTTLSFVLPVESRVAMTVYDLRGERVRVLLDDWRPAGRHDVRWDGRDAAGRPAPAGVYWVRVIAGSSNGVHRLALVR